MSDTTTELLAAVMQWHNYKGQMKYDTTPRIQPDGTIVPVVNVEKFQGLLNEASRRVVSLLGITDPEVMRSVMEVIANGASLMEAEKERQKRTIAGMFTKP